jgi:hypothetical protein
MFNCPICKTMNRSGSRHVHEFFSCTCKFIRISLFEVHKVGGDFYHDISISIMNRTEHLNYSTGGGDTLLRYSGSNISTYKTISRHDFLGHFEAMKTKQEKIWTLKILTL